MDVVFENEATFRAEVFVAETEDSALAPFPALVVVAASELELDAFPSFAAVVDVEFEALPPFPAFAVVEASELELDAFPLFAAAVEVEFAFPPAAAEVGPGLSTAL
jgi:hypothetical protein